MTAGSSSGLPGPSLRPFWPSGAKRSAIEDTVASGWAGTSTGTAVANRSARLAGLTMLSDGLSADCPMKPSYAIHKAESRDG